MKKLFFLFIMLVDLSANAQKVISVDKLPTSTEEFIKFRDGIAQTPEGGAAAFIVASILYAQNPAMGRECVIIQTDMNQLQQSNSGYKGYNLTSSNDFLLKQLDSRKHIPNSYVQGTSNESGYTLPAGALKIKIERTAKTDDGKTKVFVWSTGADSARPITLKQNDKGVWKAFEFSSLMVGVRQPVVKSKGDVDGDF
ncbi:MAG: hypothetical protein LC115_01010 [Bacteroidia bacterium]|nr:hypothetical protein [Bacteroidia bacterium]